MGCDQIIAMGLTNEQVAKRIIDIYKQVIRVYLRTSNGDDWQRRLCNMQSRITHGGM